VGGGVGLVVVAAGSSAVTSVVGADDVGTSLVMVAATDVRVGAGGATVGFDAVVGLEGTLESDTDFPEQPTVTSSTHVTAALNAART